MRFECVSRNIKMATAEEPEVVYPVVVHYCGNCTMPLEYCEYGGEFKKCREWLKESLPDLFEEIQGKQLLS